MFAWTAPLTGTPNGDAPCILNASYSFKAEVEIPQGGAEGMLITQGGRFGGYGFYLLKGKPVFTVEPGRPQARALGGPGAVRRASTRWSSTSSTTAWAWARWPSAASRGIGRGGTGVLKVDGKEVADQKMEQTIPFILQWDENLDVGSDTRHGVDDRGLPGALRLYRQDQQDHADDRSAEALAGGREEADGRPSGMPPRQGSSGYFARALRARRIEEAARHRERRDSDKPRAVSRGFLW